jgi:hypothetical protein
MFGQTLLDHGFERRGRGLAFHASLLAPRSLPEARPRKRARQRPHPGGERDDALLILLLTLPSGVQCVCKARSREVTRNQSTACVTARA